MARKKGCSTFSARLTGNFLLKNYPGWCNPYQQLAWNSVAVTKRFGLVLAHIPCSNGCRPLAQCFEIVAQSGSSFNQDIGVWGPFVVYTQADAWVTPNICSFYSMFSGCEDDGVAIQSKPDRGHVRSTVFAYSCHFAGSSSVQQEGAFFNGECVHGYDLFSKNIIFQCIPCGQHFSVSAMDL